MGLTRRRRGSKEGPLKQVLRPVAVFLGFSVVYALAVVLGRATRLSGSEIALIWPAAAVAVIWALFARRYRLPLRTAHIATLGVITFVVNMATGATPSIAAAFAVVNIVLAVVTVAILTHRLADVTLRDPVDLARLVVAVTCGCAVAAVLATIVLITTSGGSALETFALFLVRNGASALIGVSVWLRLPDIGWRVPRPSVISLVETALVATTVFFIFAWIFWWNTGLPMAFLTLVPAMWLALRYSTTANTAFLTAAGVWIVFATLKDRGVFVGPDLQARALLAQAMVCSLTLAVLALSLYRDSRSRLINELEDARIQADRSSELFGAVLDSIHDSVLLVTSSGDIVMRNARASVSGLVDQIVSAAHPAVAGRNVGSPAQTSATRDVIVENGNQTSVFELASVPLSRQPQLTVMAFRDVTAERENARRLREAALHDPLTGLANRALLMSRIEEALAPAREGADCPVGLVYLDLDGFKTVNDSRGHAEGDEVLQTVARRIRRSVRSGDTAARLGGDEFAVLCPGVQIDQLREVAERIRSGLTQPVTLDSGSYDELSVSVGMALSEPGTTAETLLQRADLLMYEAKRLGKNRIAD